jgi:hypothetical protein
MEYAILDMSCRDETFPITLAESVSDSLLPTAALLVWTNSNRILKTRIKG